MTTIRDLRTYLYQQLGETYQEEELVQVVNLVAEELTGLPKPELILQKDKELDSSIEEKAEKIIERLKTEEPLQYVFGITEFYGFPIRVKTGVLIPRRETEELVDWVYKTLRTTHNQQHILDIGTGSGCIAITMKKLLPQAKVTAWDVSEEALKVASENAKLNQAEVLFEKSDILHLESDKTFDVIVSNPPYVLESDKQWMRTNVLEFEPEEALFVPDQDALQFYKAIARFAKKHLNEGGFLFLEIHEEKAPGVVDLLESHGFKEVEVRNDMQGKPRMAKGKMC